MCIVSIIHTYTYIRKLYLYFPIMAAGLALLNFFCTNICTNHLYSLRYFL